MIAPSLAIVGGQSVQAARLMEEFAKSGEGIRVDFQPLDLPLGWIRRIPLLRTMVAFVLFWVMLLRRVRNYDLLHVFTAANWSYVLWSLPALAVTRLYGRKMILHYHDGRAPGHLKNWPLTVETLRMMDALVAPSGYLVDLFESEGIKARAIFNVINRRHFPYRRRDRIRPVFLHNRSFEELYDIPTSVRAFALVQSKYPEARLILSHHGPLRGEIEELTRQLGLNHCEFIGPLSQQEMAQRYDEADIYLTSPKIDCMPLSLLECYCAGLPVVASTAGGIPYIAQHERTALLVKIGDAAEMARQALRLVEEEGLASRLVAAAYVEVDQYEPGPVALQWYDLYRELAGR